MNRFKNQLIVAAVFALLAAIGTIMNSHQVAAQPGPPGGMAVNIVNPLPVPVTGSTTVSGTVAATQSGSWNVGITGTPTINFTNTAATPIFVRNVDNPGHNPYAEFQILRFGICSLCSGPVNFAIVPPGKRLVVTNISGEIDLGGGAQIIRVQAFNGSTVSPSDISLPVTLQFSGVAGTGGASTVFVFNQQCLLFVDAGNRPGAFVVADNPSASIGETSINMTGYFVNVP
jgi:hypothetical protein